MKRSRRPFSCAGMMRTIGFWSENPRGRSWRIPRSTFSTTCLTAAVLWYVCVSKEVRRKGVGRLLFREIEKIARENDCEIIYFTCLQENTRAQNFYRSLGYTDEKEKAFVKYLD